MIIYKILTAMEQTKDQTKHNTSYLTILSVISSFAVVVLHVNGCFWNFSTSLRWISANIIESIFYFAVPIFFMISGATLIDYRKRYDTKTFIKKRIFKTLIPFIIWSLITLIIKLIEGEYTLKDFSVSFFLDGILNTKFQSVYWFFIPLFMCYSMIIVLSLIPDEQKPRIFLYLIIAGFITISVLPCLFEIFNLNYNYTLQIPITGSGYLIFVLLGYCINKYDIKPCYRIIIYCLGIMGLILHTLGTHFLSLDAGSIISTFKGYLNFPSVLYALAIFTFFRYLKPSKFFCFIHKVCKFISPMTFGVYLIHMPILIFFLGKYFDINTILFRTLGSIGTFIFCLCIVWIIQHIPVIKKLLPK